MRIGNEQVIHEVVLLGGSGLLAAATTLLCHVLRQRLRLHVPAMRHGDHHILWGDEVLHAHILSVGDDLAATLVAVLRLDGDQLVTDDLGYALGLRQDIEQVDNPVHHFAVLADNLVLLQPGQALQA